MSTTRATEGKQALAASRRGAVRTLRTAAPMMTVRELAAATGVSVRTATRALAGWTPPPPATAEEDAAADRANRTAPAPPVPHDVAEHGALPRGEGGTINRRLMNALNPSVGPVAVRPASTVRSDAQRAWSATRKNTPASETGLVRIERGPVRKHVEPYELDAYLDDGWLRA